MVLSLTYLRISRRFINTPATTVASAKPPNSFHLFISPSECIQALRAPACDQARRAASRTGFIGQPPRTRNEPNNIHSSDPPKAARVIQRAARISAPPS